MERVADYVVKRLVENDVGHIFMINGRGVLYLTDAVAKNKCITPVSTFHEQGASYAAMAYSSYKNGFGACLVSTGCASTNALTAVLCAYQDNLPCIFISGQNILNETTRFTKIPIRTYGSQEADIISVVKSITKYSVMITNGEDIAYELDKAFHIAKSGRKGPVWIDIPLDIQNSRIDSDKLKRYYPQTKKNDNNFNNIIKHLIDAKRPVLFIGGGVRTAEAIEECKVFVEKYQIPILFSESACDIYGSGNKFSIGAVGSIGGSRAGNFTIQNADYILAVGTKLCSQTVGDFDTFAREAIIDVVDIDPDEHTKKGVNISELIIADAKELFNVLSSEKLSLTSETWLKKCLRWKEIFDISNEPHLKDVNLDNLPDLYYFADRLSKVISDDTTVITDAGFEELIIPSTIKFDKNKRCLVPYAQGAMGYAIPAIIGAYFAGSRNIIAVIGDGSAMMNIQELQIIKQYNIPAKIFIINNNLYAVIRKRQRDLFRTRTIGNDVSDGLSMPNYEKLVAAFDISYEHWHNLKDIEENLSDIIKRKESCICEIDCVEEQKYLHSAFAFDKNKRLQKRPLEDMSPFWDRAFIESEMVVKPI